MGKRDEYRAQVVPMVTAHAPHVVLEDWLVANSNLPGRRGNLELAWAFGDAFEVVEIDDDRWDQLRGWLSITEEEAPTGDPREFLPFCALQALGTYYARAGAGVKR